MSIDYNGTKVPFSTFRISTGEILKNTMFASNTAIMDAQCDPDLSPDTGWVFGHHDPATHHVVAGEVVVRPVD